MAFQVFNGKIIKGLCCFMLLFMMDLCDASRLIMANEEHKVKKISSGLNRTPLKSIKSPDGDTIDCIHILHQPAFEHPLLKNHSIQIRPSYYPEGLFHESKMPTFKPHGKNDSEPITQLWQLNGRCPEGTIPIRRTNQEDMLKGSSIKKKLNSIPQTSSPDQAHHEYAAVATSSSSSKYYGAKATLNVWNPKLEAKNGLSLSQIWIVGGSGSDANTIEVGWIVYPGLFGDTNTRLFTYWTRNSYQGTGCYNLRCSGFVQISHKTALGATIRPLSTYHGSQYQIDLLVWKDPKLGVWWLRYGRDDVGYWPDSLFSVLADSATQVKWGGEVATRELSGPHTTTQMGSGHFPEERFGGASFMKNLHVVDGSNILIPPGPLATIAEKPNCYSVNVGHSDNWEDYFYYGGPGRNPNCQ